MRSQGLNGYARKHIRLNPGLFDQCPTLRDQRFGLQCQSAQRPGQIVRQLIDSQHEIIPLGY